MLSVSYFLFSGVPIDGRMRMRMVSWVWFLSLTVVFLRLSVLWFLSVFPFCLSSGHTVLRFYPLINVKNTAPCIGNYEHPAHQPWRVRGLFCLPWVGAYEENSELM